ncbi:DNA-3-methyladenine glycosylase 2 [Salinisphaera hydrothermalis]|uniref:DNA-3-methyladenine glycosylase II n=1 Tax=Salinisphaera hydrothermalis (strain C41B8) TaxID=1304275 RepID=A0A084IGL9_SALHC|nr:DNA-3-methyladenine glycosylase 2 [Salinisphaera hydrothermalis]KEZ75853.1 regulatory protein ada [Salinisphaera hydrothermalis C41B8]
MHLNADSCYAALAARDNRFDGVFFVGVSTTGIYCRPICAVRMPGRDRCRFFARAAEAEAAGFRPCLRCRPELAPGSAPMDTRRQIADLAVMRIEAGALSDTTVEELAAEFDLTGRQLRRIVKQRYGVTPIELAQTRRLLLAKQLLTDTSMRIADIAFASGFSSVRRFNTLFRARYRLNPGQLRRARPDAAPDAAVLRLGYRPPLAWTALAGFLAARATPRSEQFVDGSYRRTIRVGARTGWIAARPDHARAELRVDVAPALLPAWPELRVRLRRLFDLDASPRQIESHLTQDAELAAIATGPRGLRIPGALDGFDVALRIILGQQISVAAASTLYGRFTETFGAPVDTPFEGLTHLPATAERIAAADPQALHDCGVTRRRAATLQALAQAVVSGTLGLNPDSDPASTRHDLAALPGIGPWSLETIAMRALGDPDALPANDLVLRRALGVERAREVENRAQAWRPWRAYAVMQLWTAATAGG